jgi:glutamine synthetase adenylyltransferase
MTRAIERIRRRYAHELTLLPGGAVDAAWLGNLHQRLRTNSCSDLRQSLRVLRQLTIHRLYELDCEQGALLDVVMQGMTELAQFCIEQSFQDAYLAGHTQYGFPRGMAGEPSQMWAVGMGKLGARELNVSSDIDLIFVFDHEGETTGGEVGEKISNHDFFAKIVKNIQAMLSDVTEHGFVFRVDLALRPYGRDGALAISLNRLAQYFQQIGREWERFAWLKSRVIAVDDSQKLEAHNLALRAVVRSFVFRRFLDHKVFVALRQLHQLIRSHADPVHGDRDIKLGRGGIREIEFAAQVMQIVRGGRQPELLARPTLAALKRLSEAGLMDQETASSLAQAYVFLRRLEHRIQYLDDLQTHQLPRDVQDLSWLAHGMGFQTVASFEWALAQHRETVAVIFEQWLEQGINAQKPSVTIEQLQAKATWTIQYLRKRPDVADELKRLDILTTRFDAVQFKQKVAVQYAALQATGLCDEEAVLDLLRRAQHIEVFRILVRDVQGLLSVRDVGDELSSLADAMFALAVPWCWARIPKRHCPEAQLAIIAYGKLGGKELGYGSDLDVVFLYDDTHELAAQNYVALVRKLITWLTVKTGEGDLYEIDTALRPNGNSGLLVTHINSYEAYQLQRGSNTAWTWELQAMTRARCVYGNAYLHTRFDAIRAQVLSTPRDAKFLQQEIIAMREKLRLAYPAPVGGFDIKHSVGGMMDIEFAVQALVLMFAKDEPALLGNVGNIELLKICETQRLLPAGIGIAAADSYQLLRDKQHAARLQEVKAQLPNEQLQTERIAAQALWQAVF